MTDPAPPQKLVGLIGGVSPESTGLYYRLLNENARTRLGGAHSARLLIWSFDFAAIDDAYRRADWAAYTELVVEAGRALMRAGADALAICSNTTHLAAAAVRDATGLPLVHLIDAMAADIRRRGVQKPLLLGTTYVMEGDYYRSDLENRFGIETLVPGARDRPEILRIILDELVFGRVEPASRARLDAIINDAQGNGADGVILGCTELALILSQEGVAVPVFDTTAIHAGAITAFAFGDAD